MMNASDQERVLLAGDADEIRAFVFESTSLPQIRGGSELLVRCEDLVRQHVEAAGGRVLYCAGGAFLCEVPAERALALASTLERIYAETTLAATATVVVESGAPPSAAPPGPLDGWAERLRRAGEAAGYDGGFAHRVALLQARLRQAKLARPSAPFFEAWPFGRRCDTCGMRMAVAEVSRPVPRHAEGTQESESIRVCPVCHRRHQTGVRGDQGARGHFNREFARWLAEKRGRTGTRQPEDLDELVGGGRRRYLALIYADGNDIGGLMARAPSPEAYQSRSQALQKGTQRAVFDALDAVCGNALRPGEPWPFEIVNIGGDDVTLLVRADYAWELAVALVRGFETEVGRRLEESGAIAAGAPVEAVTAACGVVIAPAAYPLRYLERLASESLRAAKKRAKSAGRPESALTFLWLRHPVLTGELEPLMAAYDRPDQEYALTSRPYTRTQAEALLELAREAARWPRSQRQQWAEALERGVLVSINAIQYNIARRPEEDRIAFAQFMAKLGRLQPAPEGEPGPLWFLDARGDGRTRWRTALLDVLELAELEAMRVDGEVGATVERPGEPCTD